MARPSAERRRLIYLLLRSGDIGAELPGGKYELRHDRTVIAARDPLPADPLHADAAVETPAADRPARDATPGRARS